MINVAKYNNVVKCSEKYQISFQVIDNVQGSQKMYV